MKYDLLVFDWDGTIMDSTAQIAQSIQFACRDLGLPVPTRERASHVIGLGLHDALAQAVPSITAEQVPTMVERYRHHYLSHDKQLILFDGIEPMLERLRARGHTLAVATGKSRLGLDRAFDTGGVRHLFDASRCADETRSKPDPLMLHELIDQLDIPAARTLMIGDTTHDLQMAVNAGTAALAVSYGAHDHDELRRVGSLGIVDTVAELDAWFEAHA
ncbi:HAD-IA family hydrolase [soil metagenome]